MIRKLRIAKTDVHWFCGNHTKVIISQRTSVKLKLKIKCYQLRVIRDQVKSAISKAKLNETVKHIRKKSCLIRLSHSTKRANSIWQINKSKLHKTNKMECRMIEYWVRLLLIVKFIIQMMKKSTYKRWTKEIFNQTCPRQKTLKQAPKTRTINPNFQIDKIIINFLVPTLINKVQFQNHSK